MEFFKNCELDSLDLTMIEYESSINEISHSISSENKDDILYCLMEEYVKIIKYVNSHEMTSSNKLHISSMIFAYGLITGRWSTFLARKYFREKGVDFNGESPAKSTKEV